MAIELESEGGGQSLERDGRPGMGTPPAVRVLSIRDVVLTAPDGGEDGRRQGRELDRLFITALGFWPAGESDKPETRPTKPPGQAWPVRHEERLGAVRPGERLPGKAPTDRPEPPGPMRARSYLAENHAVRYELVDRLTPESLKLLQLEVDSLESLSKRLLEMQMPYERIRGLMPGLVHLQLTDPVGHLIQVFEGGRMPL